MYNVLVACREKEHLSEDELALEKQQWSKFISVQEPLLRTKFYFALR